MATECGLDGALVARLLDEDADVEAVQHEIAEAQRIGVTGVPFFIVAGRLGLSGAQDVAVLKRAIAQGRAAAGAERPA